MSLLCAWALSEGILLEKFHMFIQTLFWHDGPPMGSQHNGAVFTFSQTSVYIYLLSLLGISSLLFFLMYWGGSHYIGAPLSFHHLPKSSLLTVLKYVKAFSTHGCFVLFTIHSPKSSKNPSQIIWRKQKMHFSLPLSKTKTNNNKLSFSPAAPST